CFACSSQAPMWHVSSVGQNFGPPPTQTPLVQTSLSVQNSPSSQGDSSFAGPFTQVPLMHAPTLQASFIAMQSAATVQAPCGPASMPPLLSAPEDDEAPPLPGTS